MAFLGTPSCSLLSLFTCYSHSLPDLLRARKMREMHVGVKASLSRGVMIEPRQGALVCQPPGNTQDSDENAS